MTGRGRLGDAARQLLSRPVVYCERTDIQTGLCLNNSGGSPEAVGVRICHAPTALWTVERA
ncbi:hypothetical protein ACWEHA_20080 [Amycolatopsis nivea]